MTFTHPWFLLLLTLPVAWAAVEWRYRQRRLALLLKVGAIAAAIVALAEPVLNFDQGRVALAVAVDTSASVTAQDLARASALLDQMEARRGRNTLRVIPFARGTRVAAPAEQTRGKWHLQQTAGDAGRATNLESAINEAVASLPANAVRRVAVISDGQENLGLATRAAWQAQQLGIPVDTIPLSGQPQPGLRITAVSMPRQVFSGERFPLDLSLQAPTAGAAKVELFAEGRDIGSTPVNLQAGDNHVRVRASLNATGSVSLSGRISKQTLGSARFEEAVNVRQPRLLLFSDDPPESETHFTDVLRAGHFEISRPAALPADLKPYQLIVYNNWDLERVSPADQARLEQFEKQGGGLLWIAGEHNQYVDHKDAPETPLARALPAKLAPPRTPEGTAVVLIIDKSSSMEGKKIELARQAAIGVVDHLRPIDQVAVLIFDNSFQWAVQMRKVDDRAAIKKLISGIAPDGGTQIAPALAEAYRKVQPINAIYKHIVLLTDGISEEGDSMTLSREAVKNHVTISTVGLGQDVNRAYLEKIAVTASGKSYFLNDPAGLEQILLKDVQEHTGTSAIEKPVKVRVEKPAELLEKVGMESAPPLKGYIRYETRPSAEEILGIDAKDPLLVRWQYGLGRAGVFTSDAKSRWAADWLNWPGYDRLWSNVVRDLLPQAPPAEVTAAIDPAGEELVVRYQLGSQEAPETIPDIFAIGPNGFKQPMHVRKVAAGAYVANVRIGANQGLFRVRPLEDSRAFPEIGVYRPEQELADFGANDFLLRQVAQSTGGRYQPAIEQLFESGGRRERATMRLWPVLLGIAIALHVLELLTRKWSGIRSMLTRPATA